MRNTRITLGVSTSSPEILTRAVETFSGAVAGLALEGVDASLMIYEDVEVED